jgi:hypothetical protein
VSYSMRTALRTRLAMRVHTSKPLLLLKLRDGCKAKYLSAAGVGFWTEPFPGVCRRRKRLFKPGLDVVDFVGDF